MRNLKALCSLLAAFAAAGMMTACSGDDKADGTGVVPRGGLWAGNGIQFFVAADGSMLTSTGSSLTMSDGRPCSLIVGFFRATKCANVRLVTVRDIEINDGMVDYSDNVFSFRGSFTGSTEGSGTWSYNEPQCGSASGEWVATRTGDRSVSAGQVSAVGSEGVPIIGSLTGEPISVTVYER